MRLHARICQRNLLQLVDAQSFLAEAGLQTEGLAEQVDGKVASMFVRAMRPAALVALKQGGVSDRVIAAMLKSRRE